MRIGILIAVLAEIFLGGLCVENFGFLNTLLVYLLPTVFGLPLLALQNQIHLLQFQSQLRAGGRPDKQMWGLVAKFFASILVLVPSLVARAVAILLFFPPTRILILSLSKVWFAKKMTEGTFRVFSNGRPFGAAPDFGNPVEREARVIDIEPIVLNAPKDSRPKT